MYNNVFQPFILSFENLYSPSSRGVLRGTPDSSTTIKDSFKHLWNVLEIDLWSRHSSRGSHSTSQATKTSPLAIFSQLFHSKLKTLLFNKSYPDSSSSSYFPPISTLNTTHHSRLTVCLTLWILTAAYRFCFG